MKQLPTLLKNVLTLIALASILGISSQAVLPNGIALTTEVTMLVTDSSEVAVPSISINPSGDVESASNIALQGVYFAWQNNTALILDARSPEEYAEGHIKNAISLPVQDFMDSLAYLENLDFDGPIITYCDGEDCNASIDLASNLVMMGFSKVSFFFGGWQEWKDAGYPIEEAH